MTIYRSDVMGFCSGVNMAVHKVFAAVEEGRRDGRPVYTIGPLIHNDLFLTRLEDLGVHTIESPHDQAPGIAVIRAHGIPMQDRQDYLDLGFTLVDGTCPRVLRSQRLVAERSSAPYHWNIVIVGSKNHGEVHAVSGASAVPERVRVISTIDEVSAVPLDRPVLVIAQTTFSSRLYHEIADAMRAYLAPHKVRLEVIESICPSMMQRQEALIQLSERVDSIIVIGGRQSANTRRLFELAESTGKPSWLVVGAHELTEQMASGEAVGITAGASTPEWIIDEVVTRLQESPRCIHQD